MKINDCLLIFFTGVLSISTTLLWWVTKGIRDFAAQQSRDIKQSIEVARQSADAAKQSADALVAVELPIFIIEKIHISREFDEYSVSLRNHGRTPAIINRDCFVLKMDNALDPMPRYPLNCLKDLRQARIVENKNEYKIFRTASITEEDWELINKRETILWVYGYIDYVDFLKKERRDGFCIAFDPGSDGDRWIKEGPEAYTYTKPKRKIELTIHQRS